MEINAIKHVSLSDKENEVVDAFFELHELEEISNASLIHMLQECVERLELQSIKPFAKSIGKSYNGALMSNHHIDICGLKLSSLELQKFTLISEEQLRQ